jgi:hypothetical protein
LIWEVGGGGEEGIKRLGGNVFFFLCNMSHSWGHNLFFVICDNRKVLGEGSAARLVVAMRELFACILFYNGGWYMKEEWDGCGSWENILAWVGEGFFNMLFVDGFGWEFLSCLIGYFISLGCWVGRGNGRERRGIRWWNGWLEVILFGIRLKRMEIGGAWIWWDWIERMGWQAGREIVVDVMVTKNGD